MESKNTRKAIAFIGTIVSGVAASAIYDLLKGEPAFNGILFLFDKTLILLNMKLPLWLFLALIIVFAILWMLNRKRGSTNIPSSQTKQTRTYPPYINYTQKSYGGILWKWNWRPADGTSFVMEGLHPCCPHDGTPLTQFTHECPRCGEVFYNVNTIDIEKLSILIIDNATRMTEDTPVYH